MEWWEGREGAFGLVILVTWATNQRMKSPLHLPFPLVRMMICRLPLHRRGGGDRQKTELAICSLEKESLHQTLSPWHIAPDGHCLLRHFSGESSRDQTHGTKTDLQVASTLDFYICMLSCFNCVWFLATLWTIPRQTTLSIRFCREGCWSGWSCPPPGGLPDPGIEPASHVSCIGRWVLYH